MKISKLWLKEWVNFSLTEKELSNQLTMAGLEVDAISPVSGEFNHVIVAEVVKTKPHPDADKLTLCEVNANLEETLSVVCGASNVRPGLKVALAMIGAHLPNGLIIKESKLRGQLSQGMLCSSTELGLSEYSEGILELEHDAPVGMDLRQYLSLDDYIIDVDLTPNRADCFSILGVAREVSALNNIPLIEQPIDTISPAIDDVLTVNLLNPDACPRYCGRVIRNTNPKAVTPLWMSERLRRSGIRTIHPVVDIMNYVMIELGQPMHAFDLSTINEEINVRLSKDNEQLELLDGQQITFNDKVLVIADKEKPLAMAGIMGGAESSVTMDSRDVFLESAFFNPIIIAGIARKFGLFSDSSQRYERGVDSHLQMKALERATGLVLAVCGGEPGPVIEACKPEYLPQQALLRFNTKKVRKLTGLSIPIAEMKLILENLEFRIEQQLDEILEICVPSHRFDIQQDVDLVEEIIRLYGYEKLYAQPMSNPMQVSQSTSNESIAQTLSHWFRSRGYHETISYSFVDPELQETLYPEKKTMQLLNPISSELSQMRAGMWPGLIASMIYNVHRQHTRIKFFEIGVIFEVVNEQLIERPVIAGILMGEQGTLNWSETTRQFDFYDLKGDLQSLLSLLKMTDVQFRSASHPALHPGQSARIVVDHQDAGWVGSIHPRISDALDLQQDILLFELNLEVLNKKQQVRYKPISKYPQIRRDLSFLVSNEISTFDLESVITSIVPQDWLKGFDVFDVYTGKGVPEGKKSIAIAMTLQDDNRTLVDSEINSLISAIIKSLEKEFSIILRE